MYFAHTNFYLVKSVGSVGFCFRVIAAATEKSLHLAASQNSKRTGGINESIGLFTGACRYLLEPLKVNTLRFIHEIKIAG